MQDRGQRQTYQPELLPREVLCFPGACLDDAVEIPPKLVWPVTDRYRLPRKDKHKSAFFFFLPIYIKEFLDRTELQYKIRMTPVPCVY